MSNQHVSQSVKSAQTQDDMAYFAPLLPWQDVAWRQFVQQHKTAHLPHGLLLAGSQGIGKRALLWRAVAYQLCHAPQDSGACGQCPSCHWLKVGSHPDLLALPAGVLPSSDEVQDNSIKIDDIRALQDFAHRQSQGVRLIVLDHADRMTVAAANALLKTLEEPRAGVHLWLVTDYPSRLMPTIKSRLQALPVTHIDPVAACRFIQDVLHVDQAQATALLDLADFAPLSAAALPDQPWYGMRSLWLRTFVALQQQIRTPTQASLYWQEVLEFADFVTLCRLMLAELLRVSLGLPSLHTDMDTSALLAGVGLTSGQFDRLSAALDEAVLSVQQNVQQRLAYDQVFAVMAAS